MISASVKSGDEPRALCVYVCVCASVKGRERGNRESKECSVGGRGIYRAAGKFCQREEW